MGRRCVHICNRCPIANLGCLFGYAICWPAIHWQPLFQSTLYITKREKVNMKFELHNQGFTKEAHQFWHISEGPCRFPKNYGGFIRIAPKYMCMDIFHGHHFPLRKQQCEGCLVVPPHPWFGSIMLAPLLLSWILVIRQWYKMESGMKQKLKTLPLLILQVYPQWRALRVLYYAKWKKKNGWQKMKEEWETGITHIGKCKLIYE